MTILTQFDNQFAWTWDTIQITYCYIPLYDIVEQATTQVWIIVFSCLVNGLLDIPKCSKVFVHDFTRKKPRRPAATLKDGIIPVVRLSFMIITLMKNPKMTLTTNDRRVIWSIHAGISSRPSNNFSIDGISLSVCPSVFSLWLEPAMSLSYGERDLFWSRSINGQVASIQMLINTLLEKKPARQILSTLQKEEIYIIFCFPGDYRSRDCSYKFNDSADGCFLKFQKSWFCHAIQWFAKIG